jgi:CHAT domain-containing protein
MASSCSIYYVHISSQPLKGDSRTRLYWCPTGIFGRLPLHAAGVYQGSQKISCSDYVVSTYTPTLTSLLRAQKQTQSLLRRDISMTLVAEKQPKEPNLSLIPQVDIELEQLSIIAESNQVQIVHQITGFTLVDTVSTAIQAANIIHLACHGVQDSKDATQSGFCLGDGRLTIEYLMDMHVPNSFLAFLSACETAKGDAAQPDQVMHLAAAMLFCGFKSVIATMWYVLHLHVRSIT